MADSVSDSILLGARSTDRAATTVLVIGAGRAPSGFARVTESILSRLLDRYLFHQLAINYRGDPHTCGWDLYPAFIEGDGFGVKRVNELLQKLAPDLVFVV